MHARSNGSGSSTSLLLDWPFHIFSQLLFAFIVYITVKRKYKWFHRLWCLHFPWRLQWLLGRLDPFQLQQPRHIRQQLHIFPFLPRSGMHQAWTVYFVVVVVVVFGCSLLEHPAYSSLLSCFPVIFTKTFIQISPAHNLPGFFITCSSAKSEGKLSVCHGACHLLAVTFLAVFFCSFAGAYRKQRLFAWPVLSVRPHAGRFTPGR